MVQRQQAPTDIQPEYHTLSPEMLGLFKNLDKMAVWVENGMPAARKANSAFAVLVDEPEFDDAGNQLTALLVAPDDMMNVKRLQWIRMLGPENIAEFVRGYQDHPQVPDAAQTYAALGSGQGQAWVEEFLDVFADLAAQYEPMILKQDDVVALNREAQINGIPYTVTWEEEPEVAETEGWLTKDATVEELAAPDRDRVEHTILDVPDEGAKEVEA